MRFLGGSQNESGSVFVAIFGAIAMVAILGTSVMTFMKGPLSTSVRLTKMNTAENQMSIGAQVAVMATASQANNGDCETAPDGYVEPIEWRTPGVAPAPTGGGLIPLSLGISKKDPWGTEYGYCVWNHGPTTSGAGCGTNMLAGTNSRAYPVVSLVSAGPDKAFTTTCLSFTAADVNADGDLLDATDLPLISKAAEADDDIITSFTYDEATGVSGGLWSIKSGDASTAVIGKNIETTGTASLKGGLLLPDKSFVTCDATTAGVMAMNGSAIEICNGTTWDAITGGSAVGGGLVLTPNVSTGINVTGGCGTSTCYSANQTFTVTNNLSPAAPSVALVTTLSNTANFEFVSNSCSGQILAAGANCMMVVRAKATGNVAFAGTLNVIGNNSPFATLDGVASSFAGCNAGGQGPGGYYVACGVSASYNLIVTPSNCAGGNTNPICNGGSGDAGGITDSGAIDLSVYAGNCCSNSITSGQSNTSTLMGYSGGIVSFPAASYCDGMVYGGYDDWFLPSIHEMANYFYPLRNTVGWANGANYVTSSIQNHAPYFWWYLQGSNGSSQSVAGTNNGRAVRCMRRDPPAAATPIPDTTPLAVIFGTSYGGPSETRTSNGVAVYDVTAPVAISISGSGGPQYSKSGGAYTSVAGTVTNGDQITLRATSPALGQQSVITLTVGSGSTNWLVRTPGNNTIRVFTTNAAYTGNLGGVGGADSICTVDANAAGLTGGWVSVMANGATGSDVVSRLPWNWKTLKNMNNQTVAVSLTDFVDGSLSAPMNYTQTGATPASSLVWTGVASNGISPQCAMWACGQTQTACSAWVSGTNNGILGDSSSTAGGGYFGSIQGGCGTSRRLLCMETNQAGADTDPNVVSIVPRVTFTSGGTGTSNTVTISGVTDEIPVEIIPSAGTANIIKDGLSVGATTTMAGLNNTLAFTLTAPTTLGQRNTATITLGPDTYTWWVGYADSAKEAKVFITSTVYNTGNFGGLSGMDSICNSHAASSSYGLSSLWKAMASDSNISMMDRISWNWGTLRTVTGNVIANGYTDLLDGSLLSPIDVTQNGESISSSLSAATGSNSNGVKFNPSGTGSNWFHNDWTYSGCTGGFDAVFGNAASTTQWANNGTYNGNCGSVRLYCIENVDNTILDTTPAAIYLPYPVQVPLSSRQTSSATAIGGMSNGATQTLSVTATGGNPRFKVNGGAEVTSATVTNGDSLVFLMDAPATGNTSNRMSVTAGTMTSYWRVWTGDTTGAIVKRIFVTNPLSSSTNRGMVTTFDSDCTSRASSAGLGGSWKAIISGQGDIEDQWAVNRIGYNWSTLRRVDGQDVVLAGNIWNTSTSNLLAPIAINQSGTTVSSSLVKTGSDSRGRSTGKLSTSNCSGWTNTSSTSYGAGVTMNGTSGITSSQWIENGTIGNSGNYQACSINTMDFIYCIEQ